MTTWLSDASANRHIKTYVKDFLDVSGNFIVRQASTNTSVTSYQPFAGTLPGGGSHLAMDISGTRIVTRHSSTLIRVYDYDAATDMWVQFGNDITPQNGTNASGEWGKSLHITADGTKFVVGDSHANSTRGWVSTYISNGSNFIYSHGNTGDSNEYYSHRGLGLSGNGKILAIAGHNVYVYYYRIESNNTYWWHFTTMNAVMNPCLNYDGTRLGAIRYDRTSFRIYNITWYDDTFSGFGSSEAHVISGYSFNSEYHTVAGISGDGNVIGVNVYNSKYVIVFGYTNGSWSKLGSNLYNPIASYSDYFGRSTADFNGAIKFNYTGSKMAIGDLRTDTITLYEYNNNDWQVTHIIPRLTLVSALSTSSSFGQEVNINDDFDVIITNGVALRPTTSTYSSSINDKALEISNGAIDFFPGSGTITTTYSMDRLQYFTPSDKTTHQFGISTDINADGSVIIVGAPESDYNLTNTGSAFIYQKNSNGVYVQLGNRIDGDVTSAHVGRRVAIDNSGNRIAIGTINSSTGTNRGRLQMYELSGNVWTQLGSDINGDADNDRFGEMAIHISGNGNVVVGHAGNNSKKYIRAYEYVDATGTWTQLGSDITDFTTGGADWTQRIALSDDGRILAFGNTYDDTTGTDNGKLQVYKFTGDVNSGSWSALGSYITVPYSGSDQDQWGKRSVSLSSDGYTVAWASDRHLDHISQNGSVQVYRYSELNSDWTQLGSDITKQYDTSPVAETYFAKHCHLSGDGNTIVVGSLFDDDGASNGGGYYVYKYMNGDWTQVATYFENLATELYVSEHSLRISKDGTHVITGSYRYDNGNDTDTGMAVVCQLNSTTSSSGRMLDIQENSVTTSTVGFVHDTTDNGYLMKDGAGNTFMSMYTNKLHASNSNGLGYNAGNSGLQFHDSAGVAVRMDAFGTVSVLSGSQADYNGNHTRFQWGYFYYNQNSHIGDYAVMSHGHIVGDAWIGVHTYSVSDRRIKTNIQTIDDASALELLHLLNPTTYQYIDKVRRGYEPVEGFIAQEVAESFPDAVNTREEKIPNIYKPGSLKMDALGNKILTIPDYNTNDLDVDASGNFYPLCLYIDDKDETFKATVVSVLSSTALKVETDAVAPDEVFVYGQTVDDFHVLDKPRIFTIMTAALQEVDRQLQAERTKTASLETELASLIADVTALESA